MPQRNAGSLEDPNRPIELEQLLRAGAYLDARCAEGSAPVHLATCFRFPDVVQLLMVWGAKLDFRPTDVDLLPMDIAAGWRTLLDGFPVCSTGVAFLPGAPEEVCVFDGPTLRLFLQAADRYFRTESGFRLRARRRQIQLVQAELTRMPPQRDPTH